MFGTSENKYAFLLNFMAIGILIGMVSCKKEWFDAKPDKALTVPTTIDDLEKLLDNTTIINNGAPALGEIASDGHFTPESRWQRVSSNEERSAYTWSYLGPSLESKNWNNCYLKIYYCNLVLEGLEKLTTQSAKQRQRIDECKGNALFTRAFTWYQLAQVYAPPYDSITARNTNGIPLRSQADINIKSIRANVQETYDNIINDLNQAKDLLPITPIYKTRGSRTATYALLARCYLSMEKYKQALEYADSTLKMKSDLIDYNSLDPAAQNVGIFNSEVIYHIVLTNSVPVFSSGFIFIDSTLYNLYDENDMRKAVFFSKTSDSTIRFKGTYNKNALQFAGLATDEMYLIRAECYARANSVTKATDDLNSLLEKRFKNGTFMPIKVTNAEDALKLVLNERKKELLLRGLRWSDLRRLNKDPRFAISIERKIGGNTYTLRPKSDRYTMLIPDDVISLSGMPQNTGW